MSTAAHRAVVVGSGVIGTIYGSVLREQGWHVHHLVRQGTLGPESRSVDLDLLDLRKGHQRRSTRSYEYSLVETFPPDASLVLVPVRLYQLSGVLKDLASVRPAVTMVIFTTNWAGPEQLDDALPAGNYVLADAVAGGELSGRTLTAALKPVLPLGAVHLTAETRAEAARNVFADAGLAPKHEHDILHWHWLQYALNAAMWPALAEAGTARGIVNDRVRFQRMMAALRAALDVCEARGIAVVEYPQARMFLDESAGLAARVKAWTARKVYGLSVIRTEYHRRCMLHALKDPKEIATAYNSVLSTGHDLGCDMTAFESYQDTIAALQRTSI